MVESDRENHARYGEVAGSLVGPCFTKLPDPRDHPVFQIVQKVLTCRQPGNWFVWNHRRWPSSSGDSVVLTVLHGQKLGWRRALLSPGGTRISAPGEHRFGRCPSPSEVDPATAHTTAGQHLLRPAGAQLAVVVATTGRLRADDAGSRTFFYRVHQGLRCLLTRAGSAYERATGLSPFGPGPVRAQRRR